MHRASMPSVQRSRLLAAGRAVPNEDNIRLCYVLLASVMSLILLCGLLSLFSRASGDSAFRTRIYLIVGSTAIVLVLVFLGWLVAAGMIRVLTASAPPQAPAPASARLARRLCACRLSDAGGVATLPAFPFQLPSSAQTAVAAASEGEGHPPRGSAVLCAVCLEDVRAGEMVRQLPACQHLFHVDCVDVWLRSHRTCPLCRCELPRRKAGAQGSADRGRHAVYAGSGAVAACLSVTNFRATCWERVCWWSSLKAS